jgi:SAM-dependent methyltransferase
MSARLEALFLEVYEPLPRQGPGDRASAARALALCAGLPEIPSILDLGCGAGGQTLHLTELTAGRIVAIDRHTPSVERLRMRAAEHGVADRVEALVGEMDDPGQAPESFDLVWSEGAFYNIGIERALRVCHPLLRAGGYLVFTDAVWRKDDPPPEVTESFADYSSMGTAADLVAVIDESDFSLVGHFTLPDRAWWDDFYTPMERRIAELQSKYRDDAEALEVLSQLAQEPEMHRQHAAYYAYELFVGRKE